MDIKDYLNLPYSIVIKKLSDESGEYYYASVQELDGCQSTGDFFEEAYRNIYEAMEGWIETKLENGVEVPKPVDEMNYSGKFVLRIPKLICPIYAFIKDDKKAEQSQQKTMCGILFFIKYAIIIYGNL